MPEILFNLNHGLKVYIKPSRPTLVTVVNHGERYKGEILKLIPNPPAYRGVNLGRFDNHLFPVVNYKITPGELQLFAVSTYPIGLLGSLGLPYIFHDYNITNSPFQRLAQLYTIWHILRALPPNKT